MVNKFYEILNFNWLFLKLNRFIGNDTKYDIECSYGIWCHYGNFLDDTSYE